MQFRGAGGPVPSDRRGCRKVRLSVELPNWIATLVCACTLNYRPWGKWQNLKVQPRGPRGCVPEIQSHHFIETDGASTHNLPQPCNSGLYTEQSASVPGLVGSQLIWYRRAWSNKRHITNEDVKELWEFVKTGPPE